MRHINVMQVPRGVARAARLFTGRLRAAFTVHTAGISSPPNTGTEGNCKRRPCDLIVDIGPGCQPKSSVPGMERWVNKPALVTGANSGIGLAICEKLVKQGMIVIGCDIRNKELKVLAEEMEFCAGKLIPYRCDVTHDVNVQCMFNWLQEQYCGPDVLICCAGTGRPGSIIGGDFENWTVMVNCNILGVAWCSKLAVSSMVKRKVTEGHIIHISSVEGHIVPRAEDLHMFSACKHAVRALGEGLRQEVLSRHHPIRVSQISPGFTRTNFGCDMYDGDNCKVLGLYPEDITLLEAKNVATAAVFIISSPPHMQVDDIRLRPRGQPD